MLVQADNTAINRNSKKAIIPQLAFFVNLHRAVIGPSATLTGRCRPDIDLRRMLTGSTNVVLVTEDTNSGHMERLKI